MHSTSVPANGSTAEAVARHRVLLAGDAAARPEGLERALTRAGFLLTEARTPAGELPPDAILLTIAAGDPGILRHQLGDPDPESPPRIVVIAKEDPDAAGAALAAGADDVVTAPVNFAELCARLQARIRDRQSPRATAHERELRATLGQLIDEARSALRPEEIVLALVRRLSRAFDLQQCAFVATIDGTAEGRLIAAAGPGMTAFSEGERIDLAEYREILEAMRARRPVMLPDVFSDLPEEAEASTLALPAASDDRVVGVLLLRGRDPHAKWSAAQLELAAGLARAAAVALESARPGHHNGRPPESAEVDPLTGCATAASLDRRLQEEFERARRYSLSFSLVVLDVDALTAINERLGSDAGDRLLRAVASRLRKDLRLPDFISRYGGDEFAIVLPETDGPGARSSLSRVREGLVATPLDPVLQGERPRFSAGIVTYPHPSAVQADDLFALAETALARGKAQVGERVGVAD